jgi:hypothetical protein
MIFDSAGLARPLTCGSGFQCRSGLHSVKGHALEPAVAQVELRVGSAATSRHAARNGSLNGLKCLLRLLVGATSGSTSRRCAIGSQRLRGSGGPVRTG